MKKLAATLALIASVGFTSSVFAESTTGNAQVTILSAITFNEDQVVDFKYIPADNGVCSMAASGVLSGQCAGQPDGTPGQFTVSGTPSQAIDISVGSGSTSGGVTYAPVLASNGLTSATATLSGAGTSVVNVIGNLTLSSATAGAKALTYVITVDYQ
jgi:hypothetical protein